MQRPNNQSISTRQVVEKALAQMEHCVTAFVGETQNIPFV